MTTSELDQERLGQSLALAERSVGLSDPNPRVGCVLGREDGHILATGWTQQVGGLHAEAMAIGIARAEGVDLRGATAWVSLEPCAHQGRTPPCADALVDAGVARVVVAIEDPFPQVAGAGIARLKAAGVAVDLADPLIAAQARALNVGFFSRMERRRPWVRLKVAASLDGRTALESGASQWITGPEARADGHLWRKRASFIVTGVGTVLADDPRLDVRLVPTGTQPTRVVLDSTLRTPPTARVLAAPGRCMVAAADIDASRTQALRTAGAEVLILGDGRGRVDIAALMSELCKREANEVHVEAGSTLNGSLLAAGWVDEVIVYLAPKFIGPGIGVARLSPIMSLAEAINFEFIEAVRVGPDFRMHARRFECETAA